MLKTPSGKLRKIELYSKEKGNLTGIRSFKGIIPKTKEFGKYEILFNENQDVILEDLTVKSSRQIFTNKETITFYVVQESDNCSECMTSLIGALYICETCQGSIHIDCLLNLNESSDLCPLCGAKFS